MKVSELLASPDKWTKGHFARDIAGNALYPSDDPSGSIFPSWNHSSACCWCISGAIQKCYGPEDGINKTCLEVINKIDTAARKLFPRLAENGLITFNDHPNTTFEHIREVVLAADV